MRSFLCLESSTCIWCFTSVWNALFCRCVPKKLLNSSVGPTGLAVTQDQVVVISVLAQDDMMELYESIDPQIEEKILEFLNRHFPRIFHRNYLLNTPSMFSDLFEISSIFSNTGTTKKTLILTKSYHDELDRHIGLDRLPKCIGGTNPVPLEQRRNFYDKAFEKSFKHCRLGYS